MKRVVFLRWTLILVVVSIMGSSIVYSQPPTMTPPPAAIPEGNIFTVAALVGSGLYLIWLKGRRAG